MAGNPNLRDHAAAGAVASARSRKVKQLLGLIAGSPPVTPEQQKALLVAVAGMDTVADRRAGLTSLARAVAE